MGDSYRTINVVVVVDVVVDVAEEALLAAFVNCARNDLSELGSS
jgi:hypothetical protein